MLDNFINPSSIHSYAVDNKASEPGYGYIYILLATNTRPIQSKIGISGDGFPENEDWPNGDPFKSIRVAQRIRNVYFEGGIEIAVHSVFKTTKAKRIENRVLGILERIYRFQVQGEWIKNCYPSTVEWLTVGIMEAEGAQWHEAKGLAYKIQDNLYQGNKPNDLPVLHANDEELMS